MPKIVGALIDNAPSDDPTADAHVKRALSEFEKVTQQRNKLVHWQWAVGKQGEQQILNLTKPKPDGSHAAEELESHMSQRFSRGCGQYRPFCTPMQHRCGSGWEMRCEQPSHGTHYMRCSSAMPRGGKRIRHKRPSSACVTHQCRPDLR